MKCRTSPPTIGTVVAVAANPGLRVARAVGNSRKRRPDCFELRPLLVIQLVVEVVERCTYCLDRLHMALSRLATASSRAGGVIGSVVGQEFLIRSAAFALDCWSASRLARCASFTWSPASISAVGQLVMPDGAVRSSGPSDPFVFRAAFLPALIPD
jgi:hypothetical protein